NARSGARVEVRAEGHDEDVGLVGRTVGDNPSPLRVDGEDGFTDETDAGLVDAGIGETDGVEVGPAVHEVELGESEHEGVVLVDDRDVDLAGDVFRQPRGELQAGEAGTEDDHLLHCFSFEPPRRIAGQYGPNVNPGRRLRAWACRRPRSTATRGV